MCRFLPVLALSGLLLASPYALAQPTPPKEEAQRLEAELARLRSQIKEVEARLKQLREGAPEKKPVGELDPARIKEMRERFAKMRDQAQKEGKPFDPAKMKEMRAVAEVGRGGQEGGGQEERREEGGGKKAAPAFGPPWARMDPAAMKEMRDRFEKMRAQAQKEGKPFAGPWGPPRLGGEWAAPKQPAAKDASVEARLDRLAREIEESAPSEEVEEVTGFRLHRRGPPCPARAACYPPRAGDDGGDDGGRRR
ncbi:MAG: hypothetical protein U0736_25070 [Gemmataceae bacterium]